MRAVVSRGVATCISVKVGSVPVEFSSGGSVVLYSTDTKNSASVVRESPLPPAVAMSLASAEPAPASGPTLQYATQGHRSRKQGSSKGRAEAWLQRASVWLQLALQGSFGKPKQQARLGLPKLRLGLPKLGLGAAQGAT